MAFLKDRGCPLRGLLVATRGEGMGMIPFLSLLLLMQIKVTSKSKKKAFFQKNLLSLYTIIIAVKLYFSLALLSGLSFLSSYKICTLLALYHLYRLLYSPEF